MGLRYRSLRLRCEVPRMAQHCITIASSPSAGDAVARWGGPAIAAWPRLVPRPALNVTALDTLLAALADDRTAEELIEFGPILAVLGPEVTGAALLRLADRLQQRLI